LDHFKSSLCLLVLGLLVGLSACGGNYVRPQITDRQVTIGADCKAHPDPVLVSISDTTTVYTLTWSRPDPTHVYAASFPRKNPFDKSLIPSATAVPAGLSKEVTGSFLCNSLTVNYADSTKPTSICYFPYQLTKDGNTCPDPGVRVVPGSKFYFLVWLKHFLGLAK
jgi:hypothetical protein